jgi:hypothetical protein
MLRTVPVVKIAPATNDCSPPESQRLLAEDLLQSAVRHSR